MKLKDLKKETQFLTLKHYKEPLLAIPKSKGYGYYGAISVTINGEKMQCHICGKLYFNVASHARQAHKTSPKDYRERFKLQYTTSLISEVERDRMKQTALKYFVSIPAKERVEMRRKAMIGLKKWRKSHIRNQPKETLESKNKKGTCPDQLLAKIIEVSKKLGATPTLAQFIEQTGGQRYKHLVFKVFGSWNEALKRAKLVREEKRPHIYKRYTTDELLDYLSLYYQENNRIPTATDCKRGLIPEYGTYQRRFGSMVKARELANIPKYAPTRWEQKQSTARVAS